jgi:hypothetical protein
MLFAMRRVVRPGMAFEQTQFSHVSGAGTAAAAGGRSLVLENGFNFSNTFFGLDLEISPTCLSITFNHNGLNTFISPYFDCVTAVNATASIGNTLINPNYGGNVVNYGPNSVGISVQGTGSRPNWMFQRLRLTRPRLSTTGCPFRASTLLARQ